MSKMLVNQTLWLLLAFSILLSAGCTGNSATGRLSNSGPLTSLPGLPPLPLDAAGARQPSAVQSELQTGDQAFAKSAGATLEAPQIVLAAGLGELQWAYFRFNVGQVALTDVQVHFTMDTGTETWIGLSNYTQGRWDITGPFSATQDVALNGGPDYISAGGYFYVLVAAYNLNTTRLQELFLTYDTGYTISGTVLDNSSLPITGASINVMPGNLTIVPDPAGAYTITGLSSGAYDLTPSATGYTFAPPVDHVPVLNADVPGRDFVGTAQGPAVTYVTDARPFFMANCAGCHPATQPLNVWTPEAYDSALTQLTLIKDHVQNDHNGTYSAADKAMIAAWVDAGGPLGATATHYADVKSQIFSTDCMGCHASTLAGGARNGAPADVNYDTYAGASGYRGNNLSVPKRGNATIQAGSMPPGGAVGASLKALMQAWIDSGWPN